jgi:hypothetical protein
VWTASVFCGTAAHWPARAREACEMAAQMDDEVARQAMLAVADNYETVAKRAEARRPGSTCRIFRIQVRKPVPVRPA